MENNKTLNPGRAGEPYVPCSLSLERAALPPSYQRRLDLGAPASCQISEAAVLLRMEITECWWAEDDLS